jgi:predicted cupin superfamily sugar epimerase
MIYRAAELIAALDLIAHPEGGYFREIHRSASSVDPRDGRPPRPALTTIYFLLVAGQVSRWHRVRSDEVWHFLEGDPLELHAADARFEQLTTHVLGPYREATRPAHVIDAGWWQAARTMGSYTLVGCTVGPGFDFADFEMLHELPHEAEALRSKLPQLAAFI